MNRQPYHNPEIISGDARGFVTTYCRRTGRHPLEVLSELYASYERVLGHSETWPPIKAALTREIDACLSRTAYTEFAEEDLHGH
jgi:hypothetical protein